MSRISPSSKAEEQHFSQKEQHLQSPQQSQGEKITFYRLPSHSEEKNAFPISVLNERGNRAGEKGREAVLGLE